MRSDVPGIAWPPLLDGTGALLAALLRQLDQTQWLAAETIADLQREQLGLLAAYLRDHSPFFAARLEAVGLDPAALAAPGGLARLPPLSRRALQQVDDLFSNAVPAGHRPVKAHTTSGSTGEPVTVRRTAVGQLHWAAATVRDSLWHGRDPAGRLAVVRARVPRILRRDDWGPPMNRLFATGPSLTLPISLDAAEQFRLLADFAPTELLIYPTALAALIRHMEATGSRIESLRHLRTVGEMLSPERRALARDFLGLDPVSIYSSQEIGTMALQCPVSGAYHVIAESVIVEVVDDSGAPCRPGEIGRILVTDLQNFATPMIRYDIGDHAEVGGPCPCGRGLPVLTRILGRERNLIRMPDGTRHWPLTGYDHFREIAGVRQYQFIQLDRETVEVRLVTDAPLTPAQKAALRDHIQATLGHPFALRFVFFESRLPIPSSGKFEEFVCLIPD